MNSANFKYPLSGSKTCCQGLVAFGFLIKTVLLSFKALIVSGIILSFAQSPPPITLPALAEAIPKKDFDSSLYQKLFLQLLTANSNAALLAL